MSKRNKIIYWVATLWLSLGMVSTGIVQLMKMKDGPGGLDNMTQLGYPVYLMSFIGIAKILGVVAILVPRLPMLKEWAYAGFIFLMSGAIYSHIAAGDAAAELFPALLLMALATLSRYYRPADRKIISA